MTEDGNLLPVGEGKSPYQNTFSQICCICGGMFKGYGHNPAPVRLEGRCCDDCNSIEVIPARLDRLRKGLDTRR
jgi:hypothetical protein